MRRLFVRTIAPAPTSTTPFVQEKVFSTPPAVNEVKVTTEAYSNTLNDQAEEPEHSKCEFCSKGITKARFQCQKCESIFICGTCKGLGELNEDLRMKALEEDQIARLSCRVTKDNKHDWYYWSQEKVDLEFWFKVLVGSTILLNIAMSIYVLVRILGKDFCNLPNIFGDVADVRQERTQLFAYSVVTFSLLFFVIVPDWFLLLSIVWNLTAAPIITLIACVNLLNAECSSTDQTLIIVLITSQVGVVSLLLGWCISEYNANKKEEDEKIDEDDIVNIPKLGVQVKVNKKKNDGIERYAEMAEAALELAGAIL